MEWRDVPDWPYEVSDSCQVRNKRTGHVLKPQNRPGGYLGVVLYRNGQYLNVYIHSLLMLAYVGPRPEGQEVRHLDGNPKNNSLQNLKYGTRSENRQDAIRHNTHYSHGRTKTQCPSGHEYSEENTRVANGRRHCKACDKKNALERYHKAKKLKGDGHVERT